MGRKTSIYLSDELEAAVRDSGQAIPALIRAGLAAPGLREQAKAELSAALRPRWDAQEAKIRELQARVAEVEARPADHWSLDVT